MKIIGDNTTPLFPMFQCDYWKQRKSFHFLILVGFLFVSVSGFGQSSLSGNVTDAKTGEPILFGDIVLYKNGNLITGEQTDFDGNYLISPIDTGVYEVIFKYVGYSDLKIENVLVKADKETVINGSIKAGIRLVSCSLMHYSPPVIRQDDFEKGQTFTSKDIERMPNKN